ncbi:MAG: TIGR03915 family putative DNA repair protein, partial [Oscillospiraceae bacterium]|nr:TIGR03915 family putative DNA repair protein [Oscillospiraceae bacterium]
MSIRLVPQSDLCYFYDGSLDGLLCCVFAAFRDRALPGRMALLCGAQLSFAERAQQIPTDPAIAERVQQGILSRIGPEALARVQLAARCPAADAPRTVLRYLALGFETGPRVDQRLTEPVVARMDAMLRLLNREAMHWQQFLRFAQLANGVFHADFAPEHDLLTLLIPYFADRFGAQPFLLHDSGRRVAAAWDGVRWRVGSTSGVRMPANHADEAAWQALWRTFYDAVAIRQRLNPKLRRNFMP